MYVCIVLFKIWDIAGLVKGASEGQGLGNAFLSHISAVDGIFHMLRKFSKRAFSIFFKKIIKSFEK